MGNLVFQATLGGQVNLVGPNTASTYNLNVPAVASTLATLEAQTFNGTQTYTVDSVINGLTVGKGAGAVSTNTAVGASALAGTNTGGLSVGVGYEAAYTNTSGAENTAVGYRALKFNSTGNGNTAFGNNALVNNTGSNNTAVGGNALNANTSGTGNVAIGNGAYNATNGALGSNTTGSYNTAVGMQALLSNTTGTNNVAVGREAGYSLTTGIGNTFIGGGVAGSQPGSGYDITTGSKNTIIGNFRGNQGGLDIRTASNYIVLSDGDGNPRGIFDGSGNFLVGTTSAPEAYITKGAFVGTFSGASLYAYNASGGADASFVSKVTSTNCRLAAFVYSSTTVGTITTNGTSTSYNTSSDYRLKENIALMTGALATVAQLKPCTYNWKSDGSEGQGFIAHELAEIVPNAVTGEKDAVDSDGNPIYQGIDTSFLVATLTAAIQEQQAIIQQLQADVAALKGA